MKDITPVNLHSRLRAVWQRGQLLNLLTGLLTLCRWVIILFLAVLAIDWLIHLPVAIRAIVLVLLVGFSIYQSWRHGWRLLSAFNLSASALKVEEHYKNLQSLLVSGVQFHDQKGTSGTSDAMKQTTIEKAEETAESVNAGEVVPYKPLQKPAVWVSALSAVIIALSVINAPLLIAGLTRVFTPWHDVKYPTRTHIELADTEIVVKEGDPVQIRAMLTGEIPTDAQLSLRTGKGKPRTRKLDVTGDACEYKMDAAFRSFDYSISAGDAESDWHTVKVITSPHIEKAKVQLTFPKYMARTPETLEAMTLTAPEGANITWNVTLDQPVSQATFKREDGKPVPLEISADGLTVSHQMNADASCAYSFSWVEKNHGFKFNSSKHYLQVAPDQAPQVELASPNKNLYATLGRKLNLAYRVTDDHGVGKSTIVFRHNNNAEQHVPFSPKTTVGRSVQKLDWDYRSALKNISIGESVTFAIEVTDFYPSSDGPHRVRSQSRRISFLSREDYLAKISAQKERLLAQLRTVYRQQRAAYDVIKNLDPNDEAFEQTCFLESSRQDILNERITNLNRNIQEILDDLAANNITDAQELAGLNELKTSLKTITEQIIQAAATQLRELGPTNKSTAEDLAETAATVNTAARELGSLVLKLGVNQAMEVFARELHVIAQTQNILRVKTLESKGSHAELAKNQEELAGWLQRLLTELSGDRDYSKSPLVIVRLSRMVKDMRNAKLEPSMRDVAKLLANGKSEQAATIQDDIIQKIFGFECFVRVGAEYDALITARDLFTSSINRLQQISKNDDEMTPEQFKAGQSEISGQLDEIYSELRLLILPSIPAPESHLLDKKPSEVPMVDELIDSTQNSLLAAIKALETSDRKSFRSQEKNARESFAKLQQIITTRINEKAKTSRYAGYSAEAESRAAIIIELLSSQLRILEKAEDADADETSAVYLAPSQLQLSKEVAGIQKRLERKNKNSTTRELVEPMIKLLSKASVAMAKAHPPLKENKIIDAIEYQDAAVSALQQAIGLAKNDSHGWVGLANLLITTEGASLPTKYMYDIVAEQRALVAETKSSTAKNRPHLVKVQNNLSRAVGDVALLLDTAGAAIDFEQAMTFAASDMGLSAQKLEAGQMPAAMEAQAFAADSLGDLAKQLKASETQYYYFVKVLEFLQEMSTQGAVTRTQLSQLREQLENAEDKDVPALMDKLLAVQKEVQLFCNLLFVTTGREDYTESIKALTIAVKELKSKERDACIDELVSAEDALTASTEELRELIVNIGNIPEIIPAEAPKEYDITMEMVNLLVEHKNLITQVHHAKPGDLATLATNVNDLIETSGDLLQVTKEHKSITAAKNALTEAEAALKKSALPEALKSLRQAQTKLRHCILEYVLYYLEPKRRMGGKKVKRGKSGIVKMFKLSTKLKNAYDKDWGGIEGEDPKAGRAEWEVLAERDRAALNENFVRELPLEYREILKDYYERLTE